jgi:hypothetical protein
MTTIRLAAPPRVQLAAIATYSYTAPEAPDLQAFEPAVAVTVARPSAQWSATAKTLTKHLVSASAMSAEQRPA